MGGMRGPMEELRWRVICYRICISVFCSIAVELLLAARYFERLSIKALTFAKIKRKAAIPSVKYLNLH